MKLNIFCLSLFSLFAISNVFGQNAYDSLGRKIGIWKIESNSFDTFLGIEPVIIANFINDTLQGKMEVYNKEGRLVYECSYINNKVNGIAILYDKKKNPIYIYTFVNGELVSQFWFYKRAKLAEVTGFQKGKKQGLCFVFNNKNGKITSKSRYSYGEIEQESLFFRNGKPSIIFYYNDGKTSGYENYHKFRKKKESGYNQPR